MASLGGMMARQLSAWHAVRSTATLSWSTAPLRSIVGLVIVMAGPGIQLLLVLWNFQVLEEDVKETFWPSAWRYALAYCEECQRQRVIPAYSESPTCSGVDSFTGTRRR